MEGLAFTFQSKKDAAHCAVDEATGRRDGGRAGIESFHNPPHELHGYNAMRRTPGIGAELSLLR
jgi:hypothetical protein